MGALCSKDKKDTDNAQQIDPKELSILFKDANELPDDDDEFNLEIKTHNEPKLDLNILAMIYTWSDDKVKAILMMHCKCWQ